ncbi:TetR/AcrR family transcriptional regulator [Pediococcus claussenii]|uniref:Transcriptional regulator, TetR family n=1 Tax=Pediococcus claussenii (strain ATCC BAA-344 / DSM 14800 / JCM 18046 / KCTC 3811 / LMG 21948 / P06) TaxID=701521 RepID=G8PAX8_PEDCP|nr:TetR/AcrR family transcriptional regulator [Pediococcus claussenii]AEV95846.1 Transcriptional regulator, TetR family [Pediococcus claussenii ATCC BAA-344]ANZ69344.1 transcriptional regulator [Pediococcus claussenii]ANZ71164.1 transcriptional regulator [Pediococcus claussenii]KRN20453.1 hypothetical protein IV79_GL000508 [Pediococcus claussenii]
MANNNVSVLFAESLNEMGVTEKQKGVLLASLELFSSKGFTQTSTRDIARMAGVSEGTVYKRFKTKDEILQAILKPFIEQVFPKIANEFTGSVINTDYAEFSDLLRNMVTDRLMFALDNQKQILIMAQEAFTNRKVLEGLDRQIIDLIQGPLGQTLAFYQAKGQLVKWQPGRILRYIFSTLLGYILPAVLTTPEVQLDITETVDEIMEFLLRGLTPDSGKQS